MKLIWNSVYKLNIVFDLSFAETSNATQDDFFVKMIICLKFVFQKTMNIGSTKISSLILQPLTIETGHRYLKTSLFLFISFTKFFIIPSLMFKGGRLFISLFCIFLFLFPLHRLLVGQIFFFARSFHSQRNIRILLYTCTLIAYRAVSLWLLGLHRYGIGILHT